MVWSFLGDCVWPRSMEEPVRVFVSAGASKHKAMSYGRMKQVEPRLAAEVAGWFEDADRIDTEEDAQRNFTDPESRIMKGADGYVQAYNCQVAVDADSHVIVAQLASNNTADQIQLKPIVALIKSNTGRQARELSADAGYCTAHNLLKLAAARA